MIDFAYFGGCRHRFILDYFGDQAPTRTCGGCDNCEKEHVPCSRAGVEVLAPVPEPKQELTRGAVLTSTVDMEDLLRRYLKIQDESRRLEVERKTLRDKIAAALSLSGKTGQDMFVDQCALHIRCDPKTVYKFDEQLLRNRLGRA